MEEYKCEDCPKRFSKDEAIKLTCNCDVCGGNISHYKTKISPCDEILKKRNKIKKVNNKSKT